MVLLLFTLNRYLSAQKLPLEMLELQKRCTAEDSKNVSGEDGGCTDSGEDHSNEGTLAALQSIDTCPYEVGDLQILSLGKFSILLALHVFYELLQLTFLTRSLFWVDACCI